MKFYHVDNKGKNAKSHWLIAKDEADAMRIASTQPGKPTNLRELPPEKNIPKLLAEGKTGLLGMKVNMMSGKDFIGYISGKKTEPTKQPDEPWFIYLEV